MSICSLKEINLQFCRRAFLLVNRKARPVLIQKDGVFKRLVQQQTQRKEERRPKISYNNEILMSRNCNVSNKNKAEQGKCDKENLADSKKDCDGGGGGGNTKLLLALAAALGIGGIAYLFLSNKSKEKNKESDKSDDMIKKKPTKPSRPQSSQDLPKHVPYLLIGGGTAAFSAFRAIKSNDARAKVLIITEENRNPYMRPPLSKELWYSAKDTQLTEDYRFKQWTGSERSLFFEPEEFFIDTTKLIESEKGGIAIAQGFTVKKIDPTRQIATLSDGYEISYNHCLIATGCKPKTLPVFANAAPSIQDKVMVYRTPDDFERLKKYADRNTNIIIVGSGFIGSELACSLANYSKDKGTNIYQIFPESGNMSKVLPDYLSKWTMKKMASLGVCIIPNSTVKNASRDNESLKITLNTGETIVSDVVVVCVGCEPNTDLANLSGLEVDNSLGGFVVNAELEARRNLFVAGDASCFFDPLLGRRRVEHHDHSVVSGRLAGENMVGQKKPYEHQSMFWSDLGPEIGYEGIGLVDSSLPTVGVFALPSKDIKRTENLTEEKVAKVSTTAKTSASKKTQNSADNSNSNDDSPDYGRGVIFYLKDEKIVGILLWNIFNRVGLARTIINQNQKYDDLNEVAKLFEIHV